MRAIAPRSIHQALPTYPRNLVRSHCPTSTEERIELRLEYFFVPIILSQTHKEREREREEWLRFALTTSCATQNGKIAILSAPAGLL